MEASSVGGGFDTPDGAETASRAGIFALTCVGPGAAMPVEAVAGGDIGWAG